MKNSLHTVKFISLLAFAGAVSVAGFSGCAATPTSDSTGQYVDDSAITTKVKAALVGDDMVKAFDVKVETFKGVVQLSGFVDTADQKAAAAHDAAGIAGVKSVQNNLSVK